MGYKPAKWPTYALRALETALLRLKEIDKLSAHAQKALVDGRQGDAVIALGDVRIESMLIYTSLVEAKNGTYQEKDR